MEKTQLKQKFKQELAEYLITFLYLAAFFSAFAWYRKLVLAEYQIDSYHYGVALFEALILAKVILIGNAIHLGRGMKNKPLIYPTLYKAVIFALFTAVFAILEHTLGGLLHGRGWEEGMRHILGHGRDELLGRCLIMFFSFIPFFAFQELRDVFGEIKIGALFFKGQASAPSNR